MKIAEICANPPEFGGGSERYCHEISKRLAEKGHEIDILTSEFGLEHMPDSENLRIKRFKCFGKMWKTNPVTYIGNALLKGNYDLVHAHSYIFFTSNQAALFKKIKKYPLLMHLHGGIDVGKETVSPFKFWFKNSIYDKLIGKFTLNAADKIASVSQKDIETSINKFGIPRDKFEWIPNAVDTSKFDFRKKKKLECIGFIGRLESWKGLPKFLEIAEKLKGSNLKFIVVGDGSLKNECIASEKKGFIEYKGWITGEEKKKFLSDMDLLVLPSQMEGVPTVCIEALSSGTPIVASNVGGTSEVAVEGISGYVVDSNSTNAFIDKINLLRSDEGLLQSLSSKGRNFVQTNYDFKTVMNKVDAAIKDVAFR